MTADSNKHLTHLDESGNMHMVDVTDRPSGRKIKVSQAASILVLSFYSMQQERSLTASLTALANSCNG